MMKYTTYDIFMLFIPTITTKSHLTFMKWKNETIPTRSFILVRIYCWNWQESPNSEVSALVVANTNINPSKEASRLYEEYKKMAMMLNGVRCCNIVKHKLII